MSVPSPIVIWLASLGTLAVALRARRTTRPPSDRSVPIWLALAARLPSPHQLRRHALPPRLGAELRAAGLGERLDAAGFGRARCGAAIIPATLSAPMALSHPAALIVTCLVFGFGWTLPALWLRRRAQARRDQVVHDLPDLIDLVVICTRAGMALEPALRLAIGHQSGPLAGEIAATLRAFHLGTPRREGLTELAERVGSTALTGLVGALLQAEELGTPIAVVLARQAELLRTARTQLLRENAARASPKVQLVVAMVMVPAALLVVLGVLVIHLVGEIGNFGGGVL